MTILLTVLVQLLVLVVLVAVEVTLLVHDYFIVLLWHYCSTLWCDCDRLLLVLIDRLMVCCSVTAETG